MKITNNRTAHRSVFGLIKVGTPFYTRGNTFLKIEPMLNADHEVRNALNLATGKFVLVGDGCDVELINAELKIY